MLQMMSLQQTTITRGSIEDILCNDAAAHHPLLCLVLLRSRAVIC